MLDIRMPGLDGLELAKALREQTSVPFLFLSAYSDVELVKRAVAIGALGYLVKPLDVGAIVPSLRTALARAADLAGLRYALESNRTIATAVGVLMARENSDQQAAVERLRAPWPGTSGAGWKMWRASWSTTKTSASPESPATGRIATGYCRTKIPLASIILG